MIGLACQSIILASLAAAPQAAPAWPLMRETNYLLLLPKPGQALAVIVASRQVAKIYSDELQYAFLARAGRSLGAGRMALGEKLSLSADARGEELVALELTAGRNGCLADPGDTPAAFLASELHPLSIVGVNGPFYFYVPSACRRFALFVEAAAPREAARLVVRTPDGQVVNESEGDYDRRERIPIDVPRAAAGQVWSLSLEKPKTKGLYADDVTISLDSSVVPYLAKQSDWALAFGHR
jgi:hypothetical protein